jgi:hypothetical protein
MGLTEPLITEGVDANMSVPRSVGNLDRNVSEFREMWQMEIRAEHPAGRVLRLVFTLAVPTAPPLNVAADRLF